MMRITGWWLSPTPSDKMMELKSDGMMTFPTYGKIIQMFQTTKQFFTYIFEI